MPASSSHVIVLIHGTFAPNSPWTLEGSDLRRELTNHLVADDKFKVFPWSGKNTHQDRRTAAKELRQKLLKWSHQNPRAQFFIIAHSHGGNVAAYALADDMCRSKVEGLITMATPFLKCTPRSAEKTIVVVLGIVKISIALAVVLLLVGVSGAVIFTAIHFFLRGCTVGLAIMLSVPVLFVPFVRDRLVEFLSNLFDADTDITKLKETQQNICDTIQTPDLGDLPVLCVWPQADEARGYLSVLRNIANLPYRLWWRPWVFFSLFILTVAVLGYLLYSPVSEFLLLKSIPTRLNSAEPATAIWNFVSISIILNLIVSTKLLYQLVLVLHFVASVFLATSIALIGCVVFFTVLVIAHHVIMLLPPSIVRAHSLAFGGESFLDNWLVDTAVANKYNISSKQESQSFSITGTRLVYGQKRHSALYSYPPALQLIGKWFSNLSNKSNGSGDVYDKNSRA